MVWDCEVCCSLTFFSLIAAYSGHREVMPENLGILQSVASYQRHGLKPSEWATQGPDISQIVGIHELGCERVKWLDILCSRHQKQLVTGRTVQSACNQLP